MIQRLNFKGVGAVPCQVFKVQSLQDRHVASQPVHGKELPGRFCFDSVGHVRDEISIHRLKNREMESKGQETKIE